MEEDSENNVYLLGFSTSLEPHEKICDLSFYSSSLIKRRDQVMIQPYLNVEEIEERKIGSSICLGCYFKKLLKGYLC